MSEIRAKMALEAGQFETGLQRVRGSVASFASSAGGIFAGAFSVTAIISGFKSMVTELDKVANTARAFGVNVEDFQRFQYAIAQTGGSAEGLAKALRTLAVERAEALGDGASKAAIAFDQLGISTEQVKNLSLGDLFQLTRNRLSEISNEADRAAVAQEVLGRASLSMASSLEVSSASFDGFVRQAAVASEAAVAAGDKIDDAFTALGARIKSSFSDSIAAIEPALVRIVAIADGLIGMLRAVQMASAGVGAAAVALVQEGPAAALKELTTTGEQIKNFAISEVKRRREIVSGTAGKPVAAPKERQVDVSKFKSDAERLEDGVTESVKKGTDARTREYEREAKAKEDSARRWAAAMESMQELDQQEEINAARAENRKLVREAERIRDQTPGSKAFEEARRERLQEMNRLRGNAPDFDPREALISRMRGIGADMTPAALQDPVKNSTVQSISGQINTVLTRLEEIARKAGSFS